MASHEPIPISIPVPLDGLPEPDYTFDMVSVSPKSDPIALSPHESRPVHEKAPLSHPNSHSDMWVKEHHDRARAVEDHVKWLHTSEESDCRECVAWVPSTSNRYASNIQDIQWGTSSTSNSEGPIDLFASHKRTSTAPWDEDGSLTFEYARDLQEKHWNAHAFLANSDPNPPERYVNNLTHVELDVEGHDAAGSRIRVQRILEVNLKVYHNRAMLPVTEETIMEFKRTLVLKSPARYSLLAPTRWQREPYHAMLAQIAQHEVDRALDERNHYLREVFGQDVDHLRTRREGHFGDGEGGEHNWNYQRPEIGVRGQDGTVLHLVERRSDAVAEGEVILSHVVSVMQMRCGGRNRLFDLPTQGTDWEKMIRRERWRVSSALDRCVAAESADRVVMDKWVEGTFLPRN